MFYFYYSDLYFVAYFLFGMFMATFGVMWVCEFASACGANSCEDVAEIYFSYDGPNGCAFWSEFDKDAGGESQSPVNILTRKAHCLSSGKSLKWMFFNDVPHNMEILNEGHTAYLYGTWGDPPQVSGGPLRGVYLFQCLCFRWGPTDAEGSEHTIDFVRFPLELQVIFYREDFGSVLDAACKHHKDGVAIISYFYKTTDSGNLFLNHIVQNLWHIRRDGKSCEITPFPLRWLCPEFKGNYFYYRGSMTTPPCSEVVTWILQPEPLAVSDQQMNEFRQLRDRDGPIQTNSRPVQKLNKRTVCLCI